MIQLDEMETIGNLTGSHFPILVNESMEVVDTLQRISQYGGADLRTCYTAADFLQALVAISKA